MKQQINEIKRMQQLAGIITETNLISAYSVPTDSKKIIQKYIDKGNKGNLDLYRSDVKSLPDNLQVNGNLYLRYTKIKSLPKNLKVTGKLDIVGTLIPTLPKDLQVGGVLKISASKIDKNYTEEEIRKMAPGVTGEIWGGYYR
jgi:hypothetical protein